jgi:hypothetical protein
MGTISNTLADDVQIAAGYLDNFRVAYRGITPGLWKLDMDLAIGGMIKRDWNMEYVLDQEVL